MRNGKFLFLAIIIAGFTFGQAVFGQSTVFNVVSTDVVAEKKVYLEADFISHTRTFKEGGFQSYGFRGVYGVGKNIEVGANVFMSRSSAGTPVEIQPNIKWKAYNNEKHGFAVSGGTVLFVPLNKTAGSRATAMVYANTSKIVKETKGTRLTAGAYTVLNTKNQMGTKSGALVAIEQPVHKKLNLVADWYSGKNRFGYAAAGFTYFVNGNQTLYAGYNFGNSGRRNNSLAVFYSYIF
jgi:hypothetical protein